MQACEMLFPFQLDSAGLQTAILNIFPREGSCSAVSTDALLIDLPYKKHRKGTRKNHAKEQGRLCRCFLLPIQFKIEAFLFKCNTGE